MLSGTTGAITPAPTIIPGLMTGIQVSASTFFGSLARRLSCAADAFADRWIPATSAGMTVSDAPSPSAARRLAS